ncbi:phosphate signaling complex protein PhoU [Crossiella cryophila]|uniref:Phosphate-specific transport system accessory protein PhoU n=1 Tax=Crossiella cryophila TaxID=43355 RepID=A0A7W7FQY3_9PSEU|nr:phosphate signaling complex protein PhoU [Crossiella cryophila]MBB4674632.1 phosphate transport system protein [Crossiella cryophila]
MREAYHEQLDRFAEILGDMTADVAKAMEKSTAALLNVDLGLAEQVIDEDAKIDDARAAAEEQAFALLALQAPVATDLRVVVAAIHAAEDLERMGDLALHVAKATRRRHPNGVLPDQVREDFAQMGRVAVELAKKAELVIRNRDVALAQQLEQDDDEMDALHKHLFSVLMDKDWPHGVAPAVDITLLGRFYERFADHAVALARRVVFIATGKMPGRED